jgi:hypothetical protein
MNKKADYMDRYFYWRGKGCGHMEAKRKAINEMIGFGLIKREEELFEEAPVEV